MKPIAVAEPEREPEPVATITTTTAAAMGGPAYDCLRNPLGAIRQLFDKAISAGHDPCAFPKSDFGANELFAAFAFNNGGFSKIPEINSVPLLDSIAPNSLVRFRGMVQDMLDTEYYVGAFKDGSTWRTNKYTDVAAVPMDPASPMQVWDRRLLYCVPVPGENAWVRKSASQTDGAAAGSPNVQQRGKRPRDEAVENIEMDEMDVQVDLENEAKRKREDVGSSIAMETSSEKAVVPCLDLNMPRNENRLLPCLVKLYDGSDSEIKLNDIVDFIGILTFDPELATSVGKEDLWDHTFDDVTNQLPPSKVPRLHCIISRRLSSCKLASFTETETPLISCTKEIRAHMLKNLTAVLGGDALAAEYFLLHIISQVHARVEPVAVGKLSLNVTGIGKVADGGLFAKAVCDTIKDLLPCSCYLPLTIDYLNTAAFSPKKNYETNRLATGTLQLASGTHLTVDETQLKAGTLDSNGLKNVRVLKNLLEWQKVEYDFQYYTMDMAADIQILILSDGKSNIFPADVVLPFKPTSNPCPLGGNTSDRQLWRQYLSIAKSSEHTIEPSMQQVVENDMVAARQINRSIGTEVFSRWLTLARLVSLSFGERVLTLEHWQLVKDLEQQRMARIGNA